MRTQEEILARYHSSPSMFGFDKEVLADALTFENVKPMLIPELAIESEWIHTDTPEKILERADDYLTFAIGKAKDHRGLSAGRSIEKLREYAWLLERDDVVEAMDATDYPQYGAPKLRVFARMLELPWPEDDAALNRMADGDTCEADCFEGCGL